MAILAAPDAAFLERLTAAVRRDPTAGCVAPHCVRVPRGSPCDRRWRRKRCLAEGRAGWRAAGRAGGIGVTGSWSLLYAGSVWFHSLQ
jgi:hypothetical protein